MLSSGWGALPHVLLLLFAGRACAQMRRPGVTGTVPRNWTELCVFDLLLFLRSRCSDEESKVMSQ